MPMKKIVWVLTALSLAGLGGCFGYSSYPQIESMAPSSPNFVQVRPAMETALKEVVDRYHPEWAGAFAVNLPAEMTVEAQRIVLAKLGPDARAMTPETVHLPTYHVARVWVRGPEAKIDIVRPVLDLGPNPDGSIAYQGMTVWLDAGLNPWRVNFIQPWSMSVTSPPDANFVELESARPGGSAAPAGEPAQDPADEPDLSEG